MLYAFMPCALEISKFNDTHREKTVLLRSVPDGCLAASDIFHMFTQSIKFYTFYYYLLKSTDV